MALKERAQVGIEARDLDTDERTQVILPAERPAAPGARERELRTLIADVHPEAKFRSFADDVATALDRQHLVVAFYVGDVAPTTSRSHTDSMDGDQGELFAA